MDKKPVLYFCCIMWNRWPEAEEVIKNIYPYIDRMVVIDGGSVDDTIDGLIEISNDDYCFVDGNNLTDMQDIDRKMIIVNYSWRDDFIASRQKYIDVVSKLRQQDESSWFILSDTDEYLSKRLRSRLRKLCIWADSKRLKLLKVRCRSVELVKGKRIKENMDNYGKELIFKWSPDLAIAGRITHHGFKPGYLKSEREILELPSFHEDGIKKEILYEHRKDPDIIWERAHCRNFFQSGGGDNLLEIQTLWKPFRELLNRIMPEKSKLWVDYRDYVQKGNVHQDLKDWYIRYALEGVKDRDFTKWPKSDTEIYFETHQHMNGSGNIGMDYPGSSEIREGYKYYYRILHPNEELDEYKNLNIP